MSTIIKVAIVTLLVIVLETTAFCYTYEITDAIIIPWGMDENEVYTDMFDFDWDYYPYRTPIFPTTWDAYENSVYIIDSNPNGNVKLLKIEVCNQEVHTNILNMSYSPHWLNIIDNEGGKYIINTLGIFTCFNNENNKIWEFESEDVNHIISEMYEIENGLLGIVVEMRESGPNGHYWDEFRKYDTEGNLIENELIDKPLNSYYVMDISTEGDIYWEYEDTLGGKYAFAEGGMVRMADEGTWLFTYEGEEDFDFVYNILWHFIPQKDASVYSLEYMSDGIHIKRYEYIPD